MRTLCITLLALLLLPLATASLAYAEEASPQPELVLFDTIWKDFNLRPKMKKEIQQHVMKHIRKAGGFRIVERGERDRTIMEKRIFVMGQPDLKKAEEIATQAGWTTFLHATFKGVPRKGIQITFVVRDLSLGPDGVFKEQRTVRNHLKPLRNTARKLAYDVVKAARDAREKRAASATPAAKP